MSLEKFRERAGALLRLIETSDKPRAFRAASGGICPPSSS